jgi:hypothetical protein
MVLLICNITIDPARATNKREEDDCGSDKISPPIIRINNGQKCVSVEQLIMVLDDLILREVKKEQSRPDAIDILEEIKTKISKVADLPIHQEPINAPDANELMDMINPQEPIIEKSDNEKTANEIVSEVEELFNKTNTKKSVEEIFNTTMKGTTLS